MKFSTFDEVKNWYDKTKPMRGKANIGKDIRPIDERRYKERRIVKIDDSCYVLSDGYHYGNNVGHQMYTHGMDYVPNTEDLIKYAPIVWRRAADGTETIAVRNAGYGSNTVATRHEFLRKHLPYRIRIVTGDRDGKHYLLYSYGETFFPKATAIPQVIYDAIKTKSGRWMRNVTLEDNATMLFQRMPDDTFKLLSEPIGTPRKRVDIKTKAAYKKAITEFREWALLMLPMLQIGREEYQAAVVNMNASNRDRAAHLRNVLLDPVHPNRVDLIYYAYRDICSYPWGTAKPITTEDFDRFSKGITPWLNRNAKFIITVYDPA